HRADENKNRKAELMHTIEVNGIKVYAYHGCLAEEERIGGNYIVDLEVKADLSTSFISDKLTDTIDYVFLNRIVEEEMAVRSKLIEQVAYRILKRIEESDRRIKGVSVKVRKLTPPINGDVEEVAVLIES